MFVAAQALAGLSTDRSREFRETASFRTRRANRLLGARPEFLGSKCFSLRAGGLARPGPDLFESTRERNSGSGRSRPGTRTDPVRPPLPTRRPWPEHIVKTRRLDRTPG